MPNSIHFDPFRVRFWRILASLGVLGGVGAGSGRGGSVRAKNITILDLTKLAWPPPASLAVKKNFFVVQILGGEKSLKFVEKCR